MYDPQHLAESGEQSSTVGSNVDRELYKDLVQMVPLVQSLIDQAGKSSFTRRGSMVYTKMPSRESLYRKTIDPKARNAAQTIPVKKRRDKTDKDQPKNDGNDQDEISDNSFASSKSSYMDQDREELIRLREQVKDLQNKISEKDELLKLAETSKSQMSCTYAELEELRLKSAEKESLIKSTQLQLSDAKIKLADKQAIVEKLQWEVMTSNKNVEKLQEDLSSMQGDISSFMLLFEGLAKNTHVMSSEDYDVIPCHLPHSDHWDEAEMQRMEEARLCYLAAVDVAKEKQDEDSIAAAGDARLHLSSFVSKNDNKISAYISKSRSTTIETHSGKAKEPELPSDCKDSLCSVLTVSHASLFSLQFSSPLFIPFEVSDFVLQITFSCKFVSTCNFKIKIIELREIHDTFTCLVPVYTNVMLLSLEQIMEFVGFV